MAARRRGRRRRVLGALAGCAAVVTACSPSGPADTGAARPGRAAPLPATAPYLVMTAPQAGWAVWPSGHSWILLHTSDGFRTVDNRTPVGVPTDGGLVGAFAGDRASVAVAPVERLVRSPVLTAAGTAAGREGWTPAELPGGVVDSRSAVALTEAGPTALMATGGGTLVARRGDGWQVLADTTTLRTAPGVVLDGVTWADAATGWLTGHGPAGAAVAFRTTDGGATWAAVATADAVAALAPCGSGRTWLLPVVDSGRHVRLLATADGGATWTAGQALPRATGEPAWGCQAGDVWMVAGSAQGDRLYASSDGGRTWAAQGPVPAGLTDLTPTGGGDGFAASGGSHPTLWAVSGNGRHFTPVELPAWVATLGAQPGMD